MLKVNKTTLDQLETQYPGIAAYVLRLEDATLPTCPICGSGNTAKVNVGIIGRTISLAAATTKFKLIANGPKPGKHWCNECSKYFE
jgi:hypothetical protein